MGPACVGFMGEQEEFEVDMLWARGSGGAKEPLRALVIENFKTVCCTSISATLEDASRCLVTPHYYQPIGNKLNTHSGPRM